MISRGFLSSAAASITLSAALAVTPSFAQDAQAEGEATETTGLNDIVVTAQRRAQNLQDTPVAVTAMSASELTNRQISTAGDLLAKVPNLNGTTTVGAETGVSLFLRGVGQDEQISTFDPAVGIYIDGIYVARQVSQNSTLFDVERVEVLRGPQGTLYGRNTSGGAVKFIRKRPEGEFGGFATASVGNYETYEASGAINLPLSDKVYARVGGWFTQQDKGYQKNTALNTRQWTRDSNGVRAQLRFVPDDKWDITIGAEYGKDEPKGVSLSVQPNAKDGDLFTNASAIPGQFQYVEQFMGNMNASVDLGAITINSITAYRWVRQKSLFDSGESPSVEMPAFIIPTDATFRSFSQELQATGEAFDDRLNYVAGVFYMHEDNKNNLGDIFYFPPEFGGMGRTSFIKLPLANKTDSFAVFGQATFHVTEKLGLTVGGRWTHEKRDLRINQFLDTPGGRVLVWDTDDIRAAGNATNSKTSLFTPKVGLEFKPNDDILLFGSYTEGFRSGGWNARVTSPADVVEIKTEKNKAYEAGIKADWLDHRLRTNFTFFRTDYGNFIVTKINAQGSFITFNAAKARMQGIEAEIAAEPVDGLNLFLNVGYLDAKYRAIDPGVPIPLTNHPKRTPKWTLQYGLDYTYDLGSSGKLNFAADAAYTDDYYANVENPPAGIIPSVTIVSSTISYRTADDRWSLAVGCRNCADKRYPVSVLNFPTYLAFYPAPPRVWNVTLRHTFGAN